MNTKFVFNRHTFINFQCKIRFNFNYPKYPQILMLNRQCSPRFTQRAARVQRTPDYATRNNHVRAHLPSSEAHVSGHESISYLSALPRVIFTRVKSYNSWQHFGIREEKKKGKIAAPPMSRSVTIFSSERDASSKKRAAPPRGTRLAREIEREKYFLLGEISISCYALRPSLSSSSLILRRILKRAAFVYLAPLSFSSPGAVPHNGASSRAEKRARAMIARASTYPELIDFIKQMGKRASEWERGRNFRWKFRRIFDYMFFTTG